MLLGQTMTFKIQYKPFDEAETVHSHEQMIEFELCGRVIFESNYGRQIGTLIKFIRKTFTVIIDNQQRWSVSPHLLY